MLDIDPNEQPEMVESKLAAGVVGSLLFVTDPVEINRLQRLAVEGNRLGIPALFGFDVVHGLRTVFPVPIAMAASWDPVGFQNSATASDQRFQAAGSYWLISPPRTGRRRILPWTGSGTGDSGRGGRSCRARCGRCVL